MVSVRGEGVKANRVFVEDRTALIARAVRREALCCCDDPLVARGKNADGPVRPEDHAFRAKAVEGVLGERTKVVDLPVGPVRFGYEAGELARDILGVGQVA